MPDGDVAIERRQGPPSWSGWLASRHVSLALVTSGRSDSVDSALQKLVGVRDLIGVVVTADDVTTASPIPRDSWRASELLRRRSADSVAFEDSSNGVAAARAADTGLSVGV